MSRTVLRVPSAFPTPGDRYDRDNESQFRATVSRLILSAEGAEATEGLVVVVKEASPTSVTVAARMYDVSYAEGRWRKLVFDFDALDEEEDWEPSAWGADWYEVSDIDDELGVNCLEIELVVPRGSTDGDKKWPTVLFFQFRKPDAENKDWKEVRYVVEPAPIDIQISEEEVSATWEPYRVGSLWLQAEPEEE